MKLINFLIRNSEKFPKKIALIYEDKKITYNEFYEKVRKLSYGFEKIGIKKGNKIALILNNSLEFIYSFYAAANLGATLVPINISLSKKDVSNQLLLSKSKYIISWSSYLDNLFKHNQDLKTTNKKNCIVVDNSKKKYSNFNILMKYAPDNYFLGSHKFTKKTDLIFGLTSGSTSKPKIVVFSQETKIKRSIHAKKLYKLNSKEKIIVSTPMYHSISLRLITLPILLGATCIIIEKYTNKNWLRLIKKNKVTFCILVASQIESIYQIFLKKNNFNIYSMKSIVSCCSHLNTKIKYEFAKKIKCTFYDTYGASEVGTITNLNVTKEINKKHTLGKIVPGVKLLFKSESGKIKNHIAGEILCKSENVFSGYFNKKYKKKIFHKKYFYTGDVGYKDKSNYLILTGRKKDIIITGGINVFASDVEKVLNSHPKIKDSAVIGLKDSRLGEVVFAVITINKRMKINFNDLNLYCAKNLADYQIPFSYDIVNSLPRGNLNKISKFILRKQYDNYDLSKSIRKILK